MFCTHFSFDACSSRVFVLRFYPEGFCPGLVLGLLVIWANVGPLGFSHWLDVCFWIPCLGFMSPVFWALVPLLISLDGKKKKKRSIRDVDPADYVVRENPIHYPWSADICSCR